MRRLARGWQGLWPAWARRHGAGQPHKRGCKPSAFWECDSAPRGSGGSCSPCCSPRRRQDPAPASPSGRLPPSRNLPQTGSAETRDRGMRCGHRWVRAVIGCSSATGRCVVGCSGLVAVLEQGETCAETVSGWWVTTGGRIGLTAHGIASGRPTAPYFQKALHHLLPLPHQA